MVNTEKIIGRMAEKNKTRQDTAEYLNMSTYTYRKKLHNRTPMTLEEASDLAIFLDISEEEFSDFFLTSKLQNATKNVK